MAIPSVVLASGDVPSRQSKPLVVGGNCSGISALDRWSFFSVVWIGVVVERLVSGGVFGLLA